MKKLISMAVAIMMLVSTTVSYGNRSDDKKAGYLQDES